MSEGAAPLTGSTTAVPKRAMKTSGETPQMLAYHLYSNTDRTTVWGNTDATGKGVTGTGSVVTTTVYGRIPKSQVVGAGTFQDSVLVTVTY